MCIRALLIAALMAPALSASHHPRLCRIRGLSYSPGAVIRTKHGKFMKCMPNGRWVHVERLDQVRP